MNDEIKSLDVNVTNTVGADISDTKYMADSISIPKNTKAELNMGTVKTGNDFWIKNDGSVELEIQYNGRDNPIQIIKPGEEFRDDFFKFSSVFVKNSSDIKGACRYRINGS